MKRSWMVAFSSLFKPVDVQRMELELSWAEWKEACEVMEKQPTEASQVNLTKATTRLHLAIGNTTRRAAEGGLRKPGRSHNVQSFISNQ